MFLSISTSAELRFAAYGGFLLLDAAGNVVKALAIGDDQDTALKFAEAKAWCHPESLQHLEEAERLQLVTLPTLRARGAERFCWVGPGETFRNGNESFVPTDVGGFLYQMHKAKSGEEAVFFAFEGCA